MTTSNQSDFRSTIPTGDPFGLRGWLRASAGRCSCRRGGHCAAGDGGCGAKGLGFSVDFECFSWMKKP